MPELPDPVVFRAVWLTLPAVQTADMFLPKSVPGDCREFEAESPKKFERGEADDA